MKVQDALDYARTYLFIIMPRAEAVLHPELVTKLTKAVERIEAGRIDGVTVDEVKMLVEAWIMGTCRGQEPLIKASDSHYTRKPEAQYWRIPH